MRVLTAHRSILPTRNVAWQQVPSVPPAPLQQLPPIAEEGESTAGKGASGEGTPSQGEGRVEYLYSEFGLDMTEVWPPVPPPTRKAPAVEHGAGAGGGGGAATPRHHRSPSGGSISVASTGAVATAATTAAPAVTPATATTAGTFPRLWGDLRGAWRFSASSTHCKADARGLICGA